MDEFVKNISFFLTAEESQASASPYRTSYPVNPVSSPSKTRHPHRYSMHSEPDPGNLVRNYLANTTDGYAMGYASAAVTPKFSDSAYSSDDYQEEALNKSAPNLQALNDLVPPPPPSYKPQHQAHVHFEETLLPHYNSKNPYRNKHDLEQQRLPLSEGVSPGLHDEAVLSMTNQLNSTRDSRSQR